MNLREVFRISINKVILVGNLGKDPEIKQTGTGKALATSDRFKDKQRIQQERTEWHNIAAWGSLDETRVGVRHAKLKFHPVVRLAKQIEHVESFKKDFCNRYSCRVMASGVGKAE